MKKILEIIQHGAFGDILFSFKVIPNFYIRRKFHKEMEFVINKKFFQIKSKAIWQDQNIT